MNCPTLSIIFVFLCFGLVYIEPRPTNSYIYDYFNLSEDNCSSIIGSELNSTLYDECSRPLLSLDEVVTDPHRISVLNEILKCVGALNTVKKYCRNNKNDSLLSQSTSNSDQLKITEFCDKIDNPFNLQKNSNLDKNPPSSSKLISDWLVELNNKLSLRKNCTQLCSDNINVGGVDYLCVVMINAKQNEKSIVSVKPTTASLQTFPTDNVVSKTPTVIGGHNNEASVAQLEKDKESTAERTQDQQKNHVNSQPTDQQHSNQEVGSIDQGQKQEAHHEETVVDSTKSQENTNVDSVDALNTGKNIEFETSNNLGIENPPDDKDQISNNESGEMLYNDSDLSQVDNRMGMDEDNGNPTNALITRSKSGYIKDYNVEEKSNLFFYIMWMFIMIIFGSMVFHNKNKLIALIVEGRRSRSRSRSGGRHSSTNYSKLHSNLEETMTSSTAPSSTHVLY